MDRLSKIFNKTLKSLQTDLFVWFALLLVTVLTSITLWQLKYVSADCNPISSPISTEPCVIVDPSTSPTASVTELPSVVPSTQPSAIPSAIVTPGQVTLIKGRYQPGKLNIAILASHYDASDSAHFAADAQADENYLLTYQPFQSRPQDINFIEVFGRQDFGCATAVDIERLLSCDDYSIRQYLESLHLSSDQIAVIYDSQTYGGSGGDITVATNEDFWGPRLFVHEFGHSFGKLIDEYELMGDSEITNQVDHNCFKGTPTTEVWPGVPMSEYYQGCGATNWYRSSYNSIMRDLSAEYFNTVSQHLLSAELDKLTNPPVCLAVMTRACEVNNLSNCQTFGSSCLPDGWVINNDQAVIGSINTNLALPGDQVTITGSGLTNQSVVRLGDLEQPTDSFSPDAKSLTFTVSMAVKLKAKTYPLTVETDLGKSNAIDFQVMPRIFSTLNPTATQNPISQVVNVTSAKPEVLVGDVNFESTINVPNTVNGVLLDLSPVTYANFDNPAVNNAFVTTQMNIVSSTVLGNTTLTIPDETTISGPAAGWSGLVAALTILPNDSVKAPADAYTKTTTFAVVEVGADNVPLQLDRAVRIALPNQANRKAGFVSGGEFKQITKVCTADKQAAGDSLASGSECAINHGSDLVIWTKHFTKFVTYLQSAPIIPGNSSSSSSNNSGGQSNSGSLNNVVGCSDNKPSIAPVITSAEVTGDNEVTLTWSKAKDPVTHYLLAYGLSKDTMQFGNPNVGDKNTTKYTIRSLDANATYYFKVRAMNHCVGSDYSNEVVVRPFGTKIWTPAAEGFQVGVLGESTHPKIDDSQIVDNSTSLNSPIPAQGLINQPAQKIAPVKAKTTFFGAIGRFFGKVFSFFINPFGKI